MGFVWLWLGKVTSGGYCVLSDVTRARTSDHLGTMLRQEQWCVAPAAVAPQHMPTWGSGQLGHMHWWPCRICCAFACVRGAGSVGFMIILLSSLVGRVWDRAVWASGHSVSGTCHVHGKPLRLLILGHPATVVGHFNHHNALSLSQYGKFTDAWA